MESHASSVTSALQKLIAEKVRLPQGYGLQWTGEFGAFVEAKNRLAIIVPLSLILILMLLIYFNSLVLLIGFELNVSITSIKHEADERDKSASNGSTPA